MNHANRTKVVDAADARRRGIVAEKGPEYSQAGADFEAGDRDTLHNFKAVAERTGQTPVQVLMTYFLKHVDSICTTTREAEQMEGTRRQLRYREGEGIRGRMDDARNYLDLLECILIDTEGLTLPGTNMTGPLLETYDKLAEAASKEIAKNDKAQQAMPKKVQLPPIEDSAYYQDTHREPTRTSVGPDDAGVVDQAAEAGHGALYDDVAQTTTPDDIAAAEDMILGYDGVLRPRSMPKGTPVQTPIFAQPAVFDPPEKPYDPGHSTDPETGEL